MPAATLHVFFYWCDDGTVCATSNYSAPFWRRNVPQFLIATNKYFGAFEEEEKRNSRQIGGEKWSDKKRSRWWGHIVPIWQNNVLYLKIIRQS